MTSIYHRIDQLISNALKQKIFPDIEVLYAKGNSIIFNKAYAWKNFAAIPAERGKIFDLASLTKPVATAASILFLIEKKVLSPDDTLGLFYSELKDDPKKEIRISQLLTHRSGLPAWSDLFSPSFSYNEGLKRLMGLPLEYQPDSKVVYSCMGYLLLGEIVRRVSGMSLHDFTQKYIFKPLGMHDTSFHPLSRKNVIPTAICPLRKARLKGTVHDENAYAFNMEGGNAGLFGTTTDLLKFCTAMTVDPIENKKNIFTQEVIYQMTTNQNPPHLPARSYGWDINPKEAQYRSCGQFMPVGSIGHLGFTGTSIWTNKQKKITVIILSNRVYYSREEKLKDMALFRPKLHDLLLQLPE